MLWIASVLVIVAALVLLVVVSHYLMKWLDCDFSGLILITLVTIFVILVALIMTILLFAVITALHDYLLTIL